MVTVDLGTALRIMYNFEALDLSIFSFCYKHLLHYTLEANHSSTFIIQLLVTASVWRNGNIIKKRQRKDKKDAIHKIVH